MTTTVKKLDPLDVCEGSYGSIPIKHDKDRDVHAEEHRLDSGTVLKLAKFPSLTDFVNQTDRMTNGNLAKTSPWAMGSRHMTLSKTRSNLLQGCAPNDKVVDAYKERRKQLDAVLSQVKESRMIRSARRKRVKGWAGGNVNVQRYLNSVQNHSPAPCFDLMTKRHQTPIIKLGINHVLSCGNSQEDFGRLVASATAVAELLTVKGYGVQVDAVGITHSSPGGKEQQALIYPIKRADEPVNPGKFLSLSHTGLTRNYWFRARASFFGRLHGEGNCRDTPEDVVKYLGYDMLIGKTWAHDYQCETILSDVVNILDSAKKK